MRILVASSSLYRLGIYRSTIGNLGLTNEQEDQLVAFLETLTDGYEPQPNANSHGR